MFGSHDLKPVLNITESQVPCPVLGCDKVVGRQRRVFTRMPEFFCENHGIYISPSTFEYEQEADNILWDHNALRRGMRSKRESRIVRDNSEDALTWNVFRFLEREELLASYLSDLAGMPVERPKTIYWSHDDETGMPWEPLCEAREQFELRPKMGSEPDLIVQTDRCLFFIEAKLTASNNTKPINPKSREKYVTGGNGWWNTAFSPGADYNQIAVAEKKYELLRFWLLGTWMADQRPKREFRLVNLLRDQDKKEQNIKDRFRKHLPQHGKDDFLRTTWESIHDFIRDSATISNDKDIILRYFREKAIGYRNGILRKAFSWDT